MLKKKDFNTVTTVSKIVALVLFVMLPVAAFYLGMWYQEKLDKPLMQDQPVISKPILTAPEGKACTMEAKLCSDGSSVGRSGPNCEFAKCPGE